MTRLKTVPQLGKKTWQKALRVLLPRDRNFWRVYAPVISILKDSREHQLIRQKINRHFQLNKQDRVLEEGCGKAVWLAEIAPEVACTVGLDVDHGMLIAAERMAPFAELVQADLNRGIPFKDGQFTKIGSILVDGYLRNQELARQERFRVLAPGGLIAIVTPRKGAKFFKVLVAEAGHRKEEQSVLKNLRRLPLAIIAVLFGKIAELKAVIGDWHFYEKEELIEAYQQVGFEVKAVESVYADQAWLMIAKKPR